MKKKLPLLFTLTLSVAIIFIASDSAPTTDAKPIYQKMCSACHGKNGEGNGPSATSMKIKPTNFTQGLFKYRSTLFGAPPTDSDMEIAIKKGLKGTTMPSWDGSLTDDEINALIDLIKSFSPDTFNTAGLPIKSPSFKKPDINRGKKLFFKRGCTICHGYNGKGDGELADNLTNDDGSKAYPRDLSNHKNYRLGADREEIYMRISTGLNGTPMFGFADELYPEEIEDIASYLVSLYEEKKKHRK